MIGFPLFLELEGQLRVRVGVRVRFRRQRIIDSWLPVRDLWVSGAGTGYTTFFLITSYQWRRYTRARHVEWSGWKIHRPGFRPAYCFASVIVSMKKKCYHTWPLYLFYLTVIHSTTTLSYSRIYYLQGFVRYSFTYLIITISNLLPIFNNFIKRWRVSC